MIGYGFGLGERKRTDKSSTVQFNESKESL